MRKFYINLITYLLGIWVAGQTINEGYGFYEEDYDQGTNIPSESITDNEGNTYITGTSSDEDTPTGNIFTIKLNTAGEIVWEAREATPDFAVAVGYAITLDTDNNPIVSGSHWNGHDMDIVTIKYDKLSGIKVWGTVFDGGHSAFDYPSAITTDTQGNVIVAGYSYYADSSVGYTVLKYSPSGNLLWSVIEQNEVSGTIAKASDVAVDNNGNIALTGIDVSSNGFNRYHTILYNADGNLQWKRSHLNSSHHADARAVAFDDEGNVYVTGTFAVNVTNVSKMGTLKYSLEGELLWERTYTDTTYYYVWGHDLKVVDDRIYTAGTYYYVNSDDDNPYDEGALLIAYDLNGEQQWLQKNTEQIQAQVALSLDSEQNPVIGSFGFAMDYSSFSIKLTSFDSDGQIVYGKSSTVVGDGSVSIFSLAGLGTGVNNDLYLTVHSGTGEQGDVYETQKWTLAEESPVWVSTYHNQGRSATRARDGKSDSEGNTVVLAYYHQSYDPLNLSTHPFIMKQDDQGNVVWKQDMESYTATNQHYEIMDINSQDEIIVVSSDLFGTTVTLRKYSIEGELLWETEKEAIRRPEMTKLIIDENNNIYVVGTSFRQEEQNKQQFTVLKYASDGTEIWTNHSTSDDMEQMIYSFASAKLDLNGNLLVIGTCGTFAVTNTAVLSVSNSGTLNWLTPVSTENALSSSGFDLDVDSSNNIYAISRTNIQDGNFYRQEGVVTKLTPFGDIVYSSIYGQTDHNITPYNIYVLPNEQLAVVMGDVHPNGRNKVATVKYDMDGNQLNVTQSAFDHFYRDSYMDEPGNVYTLLQVEDHNLFPQRQHSIFLGYLYASIMKTNLDHSTQELVFQTPEQPHYWPFFLISHADGRLIVTGELNDDSNMFSGMFFFESEYELLSTDNVLTSERGNWLGQNYPNPVKGSTTIPFKIKDNAKVSIYLYSSDGKYIRSFSDSFFSAGENTVHADLSGLPKGIYFYQLRAGNFVSSKKLIVQ